MSPLSPDRWRKIEEIFLEAVEISDAAARARFLDEACSDDKDLRDEVEKLIRQDLDAESLLEKPLADESGMYAFADLIDDDPLLDSEIGKYKIIRELGSGGMGAVYLAERNDGIFRKLVALKIVKRGMDTKFILRRFRQERQVLALLNHRYIAALLDGGTTPDGLPYFVMDYIEGEPLYRYADHRNLSIRDRLKLFVSICEAVDYAHQNQVIHRDLKPSNILIKADETPRLLDFGIAKVFNPEFQSDITLDPTLTAMRMMTPEYASPEQIKGEIVTAASDIYSLGVLLYELLTGHRPYRFANRAPHEVARVICEESPAPPSTEITKNDNFVPSAASRTREEIYQSRSSRSLSDLQREIEGDLEQIVMKALRKNPAERYKSAADFAEDIENYLGNRPVKAEIFSAAVSHPRVIEPATITSEQKPEKFSIAILPLTIVSAGDIPDTGEAFLGIGLADALILRLSGVKRLVVRPTSSILKFQGGTVEPFAAGRELDVEFIVEGTIRRVDDRLRVSIRLLSMSDKETIWAERFDEKFTDVLKIEDSISERLAKSLIPKLTSDEENRLHKRGTNNAEAYEAYLRGRFFANQFNDESLPKAVEFYREAVRLDPDYALAHVGIADFYVVAALFGMMPAREAYPKAKEELKFALASDDKLVEAISLSAFIAILYDWDWAVAESLVNQALELNPNFYLAHDVNAHIYASQGITPQAIAEIKRAENLDLLSPRPKLMTSCVLYQSRSFDEGASKAKDALEMQKNSPFAYIHYGNSLTQNGNSAKAVEILKLAVEFWQISALPRYMLSFALVAENRRAEAEKLLQEVLELNRTGFVKPYFIAMTYTALGKIDEAFQWFEKSVEARDDWLLWFGSDIKLDVLRNDPRYFAILKKLNNPIYKRQFEQYQQRQSDGKADESSEKFIEKSIAVLPFRLFRTAPTGDTGEEYLSVGLADALTLRLSNVRRFVVRPTSSVLKFQGEDFDPITAGRELDVEFIVEGTIKLIGERLRVSIQLLSVNENKSRWAQNFDEKMTDVLEIEDSISARVAESLVPHLTGDEQKRISKRGTNSPEAYQAYLRGRFFWNQFTPDTFPKVLESYRKAVDLDPDYALAHVGIADFYNWAMILGFYDPRDGYEKTRAAAKKALELDPMLGEAVAVLGFTNTFADNDLAEGERLFERALTLNPNHGLTYEWYSGLLAQSGRNAEAEKAIRRSLELDPLSIRTITLTAWTLYHLRKFPEALAKSDEVIEMNPLFYQGYFQRGNVLTELNRAAEAVTDMYRALELAPNVGYAYQLCFALAKLNRHDEARGVLQKLQHLSTIPAADFYHYGMCCAALGEKDQAFEWFNKAIDERNLWVGWLATEPKLDPLRTDPRFDALLKRINREAVIAGKINEEN